MENHRLPQESCGRKRKFSRNSATFLKGLEMELFAVPIPLSRIITQRDQVS